MSNGKEEKPLTLNESFKKNVRQTESLINSGKRQDSAEFQKELMKLLVGWLRINQQIYQLGLFSDNEGPEDLNTKDIKFLATKYYLGELIMRKLDFVGDIEDQNNRQLNLELKIKNLRKSREYLMGFLIDLKNYKSLNSNQMIRIVNIKDLKNPKIDELRFLDPAQRRDEKIQNFKLEKTLNEQIQIFAKRYPKFVDGEEEDESSIDEEMLRGLYLNKLKIQSLKAFSQLELSDMELQVLQSRPPPTATITQIPDHKAKPKKSLNILTEENNYGYTERLEKNPMKDKKPLLSAEGKILQPFTLVGTKEDVKKKVFGYGQTLPTMSVEEYIEEEIKRGGIKTETITGQEEEESSDDSDDDDEKVYEKREWDEFKDTHARGEGNMKNKG